MPILVHNATSRASLAVSGTAQSAPAASAPTSDAGVNKIAAKIMSAGGLIVLVLSLILSPDAYGISLTTTLCTLAGFCVLVYGVLYLATAPGTKPVGCVTEIVVYPLKSARGRQRAVARPR